MEGEFKGVERRTNTITLDEETFKKLLEEAAERGADNALKTLYATVGGNVVKKFVWLVSLAITLVGGYLISHFTGIGPK